MSLPATMKALVLRSYETIENIQSNLHLDVVPVPKPGKGEVLVKMEASPVNPSDLMFIQGRYAMKWALPTVPGLEGAGTVVAAGKGFLPKMRLGKRVAVLSNSNGPGLWAEYAVVPAITCFPVPENIPFAQAASMLVNPLSAYSLYFIARQNRAKAVIVNASGSQLIRKLIQIAGGKKLPLILIVHKQTLADEFIQNGHKYVINTTLDNYQQLLASYISELKPTVFFDAVAGASTGDISGLLPENSKIIVYGALDQMYTSINPANLIFKNLKVEGFWLATPQKQLSKINLLRLFFKSRKIFSGTDVVTPQSFTRVSYANAIDAMIQYNNSMSSGKVFLTPDE